MSCLPKYKYRIKTYRDFIEIESTDSIAEILRDINKGEEFVQIGRYVVAVTSIEFIEYIENNVDCTGCFGASFNDCGDVRSVLIQIARHVTSQM